MSFWDQQFSAPGFKYGTAPNAFLREHASHLTAKCDILVPGDGEGRNGVWLAEQGHRVTTVDNSAIGIAKAQALAAERGVVVHAINADLTQWAPAPRTLDAVVLMYVHFPPPLRARVHGALLGGLRDNGILVLEAFHPRHRALGTFGPKDIEMLCTLDMLREDLRAVPHAEFDELVASEEETTLDEGPGHRGDAIVTRLVARCRLRDL